MENIPLEMVDQLTTKLIQQVPALIALIWIVWQFLRHMSKRDDQYLSSQKEINEELHGITATIKGLAEAIEHRNKDVCQFHHDFQQSLHRIENAVSKNCGE